MAISKENAIKAYKVFNKDWSCKGFQYEVGKEYQHKGKIQICESGFHSCEKLSDCFNYYPFQPSEIKVAEVLAWGDVKHEESSSKICSSRIEITKELEWAEVLKICNSGNRNSGDWNSGYFNTPDQKYIFIFNKRIEKSILNDIRFPCFLYFKLTEWVSINQMSYEEKNKHPECDAIGGYLKTYSYKEAFRKSFEMAKRKPDWQKQLALLKAIPNFDAKIFEEISGIREEELV